MSLGTLDRTTPSFMRQGPSALSQIVLYIALALLLMLADVRWRITDPLRQVVSTVLYPVQWLMVQPLEFFSRGADYFHALQTAQDQADTARKEVLQLSLRANQAQELLQENERLLVVLLLQILEQVKPVVVGTSTQLDDIALEALITALRREEQDAVSARSGNSGKV